MKQSVFHKLTKVTKYVINIVIKIHQNATKIITYIDISASIRCLHQKKLVLSSSGSSHDGRMPLS